MTMTRRWLDPLVAACLFAFCFLLYNATLTPGLSYASPDGNELTTVSATLGLAHPTGYPLFTWLGFLFVPVLILAGMNAKTNNRTTDTAIGDFYRNVNAMLPRDSVLIGRRGVFGYDMYYWRMVYNVRPDVALPMFDSCRRMAPGAPMYKTVRVMNGEPQSGVWCRRAGQRLSARRAVHRM